MTKKDVKLSKEFKAQATKAIFAICFFVFTYSLILLLTIALTGVCIYAGSFVTLALGIGLSSMGILVLIFLLKFSTKASKSDYSHLIEIDESQDPKLFNLIRELIQEVGTRFPKKVYLSSEVNAAVFYDSSFWSMFLPTQKNLQIGLGLVNTVSQEELKAILAHEFGHFSQRTMKVGSYVYNVNRVIFNMLYDNESYKNRVHKCRNFSWLISLFVVIAIQINQGIQWVLRQLYDVVNKNYMGLSREMEFHADEIAASITGFLPLKKSLLRMGLADASFNNILDYYSEKVPDNIKSENIYSDQSRVIHFLAELNNYTLTNNLPDVSLEEQSKFDKSKLVIKNQWASHPRIDDRIKRLVQSGYSGDDKADELANDLFTDILVIQKRLTDNIFKEIHYEGEAKAFSSDKFIEAYKREILSKAFSKMYNSYYDYKNPVNFDLGIYDPKMDIPVFSELYSDEKVDLVYSAIALQNDIETLKNIANKTLLIKTFDYDGVRYVNKEAGILTESLKSELEIINERIERNDADIYIHFLHQESIQNKPKVLGQIYSLFFAFDRVFDSKFNIFIQLSNELQFVHTNTPFGEIGKNLDKIKQVEEVLKEEINVLLSDDILSAEITQEIRDNLNKYSSEQWEYFDGAVYSDDNLNILFKALHNYSFLLSRKYFLMKKTLLAYQAELVEKSLGLSDVAASQVYI